MRAPRPLLPFVLSAAILSPAALAQDAPLAPRVQESLERFDDAQERVITAALRSLDSGNALQSALTLIGAIEMVGKAPPLVAALDTVKQPAAEAAAARVAQMLTEGNTPAAIQLLADLAGGVHSDELDALIDRATVAQRLEESARLEADGQKADAMRAAVLASNIAPNDPRVLAAMTRLGLRTAIAPATTTAPVSTTTTTGDADDRIDALERELQNLRDSRELGGGTADATLRAVSRIDILEQQVRTLDGLAERLARSLDDIQSRERLGGRAEYATDELDRRLRDLERTINESNRSISRLESDMRDLSRRIDRIR
jgi:hypothetical protein